MLIYLLGSCCVAWTVLELSKLMRRGYTMRTLHTVSRPQKGPGFRAWDETGRPLPIDEV